ncbi:uncharacterized protein LOC107361636 [Tetranychus urticae]|uniref:Vitellogenin n=1 Tax=Tetranychus urticae TaxID=32264 RepID=T1K9M5_TETUR|nr:uncharacterized protein LOC107361636 [Tetranychus urticae]
MNLQYLILFLALVCSSSTFKVGQKYVYNYRLNTLQSLSSRSGASTWARLNLEVTPITSTEEQLSLRFKISSIANQLGPFTEPTEATDPNYGLTSEFVGNYNKGKVEIKVASNDGRSAVGLKKSISSLFNVQKNGETSLIEDSPVGSCNTIYSVTRGPSAGSYNLTKTRNYENCTQNIEFSGKKFSSPEFHKCTKNPEYSIPWVSRSSIFTYSINDGAIKSCESIESVSFALFGHKSSSSVEIKGNLNLESSTAAAASAFDQTNLITVQVAGKSDSKTKESFDSAVVDLNEPSKYVMWPKQEVANIIKTMETLSSSVDLGMSSAALQNDNFTMDFIELQLSISRLSLTELQSLYSTIKSRSDAVPKIFLDTLRYTPSNPVFSFVKSFVKSTDAREKYALRAYFQTIPFRELKVSKALLDGYLDLCKQTLGTGMEATCFFSMANILQVHCSDSPMKTVESCNPKISVAYYNKMIAVIREIIPASDDRDMLENGISNNVYNEESLKLLLSRISDPRLHVRRTATVALFGHRFGPKSVVNVQNVLFGKIMDRKEDHVVRIYALLVYMKTNPPLSQFRAVIRYISDPSEDEQVAHYTLSLMKMMKHSENPCYAGFSLLARYAMKELKQWKGRFAHTTLALSTARVLESYDKEFAFGGSTVISYILNKKSASTSFYVEEKMVVNGYTGGHLAMLWETFPETKPNGSVTINPKTTGYDENAAAIIQTMASIWNGTPKPAPVTNNKMRLSFMINGRVVDSIDPMQLLEIFTSMTPSINKFMIGQQFYNYIPSEHGFTLFNLMVSGNGLFARTGAMDIDKKQNGEILFRASLSPTVRRDIGAYTLTGLKSPIGSDRAGIMTSIQRTHRLPLNISYAVTKKTAHLKFKMPTEATDFMFYRMNAYTFNDKTPIGSVRSTLKPLFTDFSGKQENDLVKSKTYWKGFLGNGLRMTTTINRPRPMDGLGYRYMLLEKSLYNDDIRLVRMKFEYGGVIVPIDWRLTFLPDPKVSELTFAFNRSLDITDDARSGEYQMTVLKNSETIISTRVSYTYSTDFLNHYLRLYYNNYLKNIHTCIKGDIFAPKVNYARYTSIDNTANLEDKLHFNGSIYFDQSCSKKDIIVKGEFSPSEAQKDPKYSRLYSQSCGKNGLATNKIPYCAGYHYHTGELRSVKVHVTHKDVPAYFWRYVTWFHNKGIQKYADQVKYRASNEVTDPTVTLITANSTWFTPYKYNVSYKMVDREEFWENIPSTGLSWPNSFSLFDFHVYQAFHRTLREPYCYIQKSRVRTFDESSTNVTVKPNCFKTLLMDCTQKDKFTVLFSQDAEGKLETIEIYLASPATKLEISPKTNIIKSNGAPVDLTAKDAASKGFEVKDFGIYKRVSLVKDYIKIYYDDVGILVRSSKMHYSQLCGLCGNMNGCSHDDHGDHHHSHNHSEYLWLTKDARNTAPACVQQ